jgi:tetratricopeptide (TPR) repeat protein
VKTDLIYRCRFFWLWVLLGWNPTGWTQSPPPPQGYRLEIEADAQGADERPRLLQEGRGLFVYPERLACGDVISELDGRRDDRLVIPIELEEGLRRAVIRIQGGSGDADMYLSYGEPPGLFSYEYRPYVNGNVEEIFLDAPQSGRWFLMLHGYRDFRDVQVSLSCVREEFERPDAAFLEQQDLELALYYELSGLENTNLVDSATLQGQVLNRRGRQAFTAGRFDDALAIWSEWMEVEPDNPRPVSLVGDLYLRADKIEEAVSYYERSLDMQPGQLGLMARLARILDVQAKKPMESRDLLNRFSRLFPDASVVALAQAEWLIRRARYEEAVVIIQRVIETDPENLNAMSLLHPLLRTQEQRYANMLNMLRVGKLPGRETSLGFAVRDNDLLTRPESWVLMEFLDKMSGEAPTPEQRRLFSGLQPRETITVEDFRIGRMSTNWISSREETWGEEGNLILAADPTQTEAFLRLDRSDAMHNGFVEAEVDDTRGFFWIYARRGQGNMIRFGFEESGQLYLQVWMNHHLVTNETRMWSRLPGTATLRLEIRGDGALGFINGSPAFGSPVSIPDEMGLGWWGIAPWSAMAGEALVSVRKISGGPLPARLGLLPISVLQASERQRQTGERTALMNWLDDVAVGLSTLAPEWFSQGEQGDLRRLDVSEDLELRLLARYYRMRLLPLVRVRSYRVLDLKELSRRALEEKLDGFTLLVDRLPDPQWLADAEALVIQSGLTLHFVMTDRRTGKASFRELCGSVGIFPGPRRIRTLPLETVGKDWSPDFKDADPNLVLLLDGETLP